MSKKKSLEVRSKFEEDLTKLLDIDHHGENILEDRTRAEAAPEAATKVPAIWGRTVRKKVEQ